MDTILFLAANPTNTCQLRVSEELRRIQIILQASQFREQFRVESRGSVRPQDISLALLEISPKIVHFSGHGNVSGSICVENERSELHPIEPDALARLFSLFEKQIHCVILNACYSAVQAEVIVRHVPYVIGMSDLIEDTSAVAFTEGFYQALGAGKSIKVAYDFGKAQMALQNYPEAYMPVLLESPNCVADFLPLKGRRTLKPFGEVECEAEVELLKEHYSSYYFADVPFSKSTLLPESYLIIGRRGAGKTALCEYFKFQDVIPGAIAIDINDSDIYQAIALRAASIIGTREVVVPLLAKIWEFLVWIAIFDHFKERDPRIASAYSQYCAGIAYPTFSGILDLVVGNVDLSRDGKAKFIQLTNEPRFARGQNAIKQLAASGLPIIVSVDTLENVEVEDPSTMWTLASLVEFAKEFNRVQQNANIYTKVFLMAEVFPLLRDEWVLNLAKSIQREVYMHWRAKDLMRLMCWRLYQYLKSEALLETEIDLNWGDHKDVLTKIWYPYFGRSVSSQNDVQEDTVPYVLRHTQMRPRQLIMLCDEIALKAIDAGRFPYFSQADIVEGIEQRTADLANEVLNSYNTVYPRVSRILDAMAGLPVVFSANELDRRAHTTAAHWPPSRYSPSDFRQLVAELGIVGRVRHVDEYTRTVTADFEYFMRDRLGLLSRDLCAVHPMFYKRLRIDTSQHYIVYPGPGDTPVDDAEGIYSPQLSSLRVVPLGIQRSRQSIVIPTNGSRKP